MRRRLFTTLAVAGLAVAAALAPGQQASAVQSPQDRVVSAQPASWTPNVLNGQVEAIVQVGGMIIIGGQFSQVQLPGSTTVLTRNNIVAFDATTGALSTTFVPSTDGEVTSLLVAPGGQSVYLGGFFNNVNGTGSASLARIDIATGKLTSGFHPPQLNGRIKDLRIAGGRLWIAGTFSTVAGVAQPALATVDPTTGARVPYMGLQIAGTHNGGTTQVLKMDVTPDGTKLVGIGNFLTVSGQPRSQIFMLNLTGTTAAALATWQTNLYTSPCLSTFDSYMRDVDISPDGTYFVVSTTGGYGGSTGACDQTSRWETGSTAAALSPTWTDYTGGDTTYAVAVTGTAVYTGGHFRWQNNPLAGNAAGGGAVPRSGITALDPANGLPLRWNPGRTLGVGVFDMLATPAGLWVGSDTDRIGNNAYHARIAFFPLAGGEVIPASRTGSLPGQAFLAGRTSVPDSSVLYRVNAGGPSLPANLPGPDWAADTAAAPDSHHNTGGSVTSYTGTVNLNSNVPLSTPRGIFDDERWDGAAAPEMHWGFPVTTGAQVSVRLYFANRYAGTAQVGQRRFNVLIDGATRLSNYDIVADTGNNTGTMKAFNITSDGNVDIDLRHVTENPLIDGIEIIRTDQTPVLYRVNAGGARLPANLPGPDWSSDTPAAPDSHHGAGTTVSNWSPSVSFAPSVPPGTPAAIFDNERWDPPAAPEMHWGFGVAAGTPVTVRLYFANRYAGTSQIGQRKFNVLIDNVTKLSNFDIVADAGNNTGTMKAFNITSDGNVDIDFRHVTENPLIDGIEIVRSNLPAVVSDLDRVQQRSFDGQNPGATSTLASAGITWSQARGATMINGTLYYGWSDGNFYSRTFNGSAFGAQTPVNTQDQLVSLGSWHSEIPGITSMFFDASNGRLYYTLGGQSSLFYRYFTPESNVVGALRFTASTGVTGVNFAQAGGAFLVAGKLYLANRVDGSLTAVNWSNGAPVAGTAAVVSSPATDGADWRTRALFLLAS